MGGCQLGLEAHWLGCGTRTVPKGVDTVRVLVTEGGSGQGHASVSVVRALAVAGHDVAVTVSGRFSTAAWSRHCTRRFTCPPSPR